MKVIATSKPIRHGNRLISKSLESLNKLLSIDSLPIVDEHNGSVIGSVSNFVLRVKNGVTEVLADIPNTINTLNKGFSLQFTSKLVDDVFHIDKFHHLALTGNPRDSMTFSESDDTEAKVDETVSKPEDKPESTVEDKAENTPETKTQLTSDELLAMLNDPSVQARLMAMLNVAVTKEESTEVTQTPEKDKVEAPKDQANTTKDKTKDEVVQPIRVVIKPNVSPIAAKPKPNVQMKVKQLPFPTL